MKLKKTVILLVGLALSCSLFTGTSLASGWIKCYPKQIGPAWSITRLIVTDCNLSTLPFKTNKRGELIELNLDPSISKEGTAVTLAAMAWGTPVSMYVDDRKVDFTKKQYYATVKAILAE